MLWQPPANLFRLLRFLYLIFQLITVNFSSTSKHPGDDDWELVEY